MATKRVYIKEAGYDGAYQELDDEAQRVYKADGYDGLTELRRLRYNARKREKQREYRARKRAGKVVPQAARNKARELAKIDLSIRESKAHISSLTRRLANERATLKSLEDRRATLDERQTDAFLVPRARKLSPEAQLVETVKDRLGKDPDAAIGQDIGLTAEQVRQQRRRLGIKMQRRKAKPAKRSVPRRSRAPKGNAPTRPAQRPDFPGHLSKWTRTEAGGIRSYTYGSGDPMTDFVWVIEGSKVAGYTVYRVDADASRQKLRGPVAGPYDGIRWLRSDKLSTLDDLFRGVPKRNQAKPRNAPKPAHKLHKESWWPELVSKRDDYSLRELSEMYGPTVRAIHDALKAAGKARKPSSKPKPKPVPKSGVPAGLRPYVDQLGKVPDEEIATLAGMTTRTVANHRRKLGIAGYKRPKTKTTAPELPGKVPRVKPDPTVKDLEHLCTVIGCPRGVPTRFTKGNPSSTAWDILNADDSGPVLYRWQPKAVGQELHVVRWFIERQGDGWHILRGSPADWPSSAEYQGPPVDLGALLGTFSGPRNAARRLKAISDAHRAPSLL